ncbi:MAG: hypothetical protein HY393_03985 [Candidatus Diapherotrites archaeon]|nr:hypothetical protein [Candidatus Diapherotrites archaeon]
MGKALVVFRISPVDVEESPKIMESVKGLALEGFKDCQLVPIGFGASIVKAAYVIEDKDAGAIERLTMALKRVQGVEQVEVERMDLL